jgi:hypothetical protein
MQIHESARKAADLLNLPLGPLRIYIGASEMELLEGIGDRIRVLLTRHQTQRRGRKP